MITTGGPSASPASRTTEVVDVVNGEKCADLADFPLPNAGAVGANINGTPVVCGGAHTTHFETCYKFTGFTNGGWQQFAYMKHYRKYAAGVMFQNNFHVFGGRYFSERIQTSELISIDGWVEYGPKLPTAIDSHAITSINSTVSILSGGTKNDNTWSPLTWYFNHEVGVFSPGSSLLEGRKEHGSATCVDNVNNEKIPVVTGGYGSGDVYLDSTELLINEQWQPGTIQCKKETYFDLL